MPLLTVPNPVPVIAVTAAAGALRARDAARMSAD
jgi:hypothetical protein